MGFCHLHVHSEFSLRDSLIKIDNLIEIIKGHGMDTVAITDHGAVSGILEFYLKCLENGVRPIIGIEAYAVKNITIQDREEKRRHIVLLAKNEKGYRNLVRLASVAGERGFYYVPRIDLRILEKYREGLICLTACCFSSIVYLMGEGGGDVLRIVRLLRNLFGRNLYLEIQPHEMKEQKKHNILMDSIGRRLDLPLVATQDVHFYKKEDKEVHDVLMRIQGREPYTTDTIYLSTKDEMYAEFKSHDYLSRDTIREAISNTGVIADEIENYNIPIEQFFFPSFELRGV